MAERQLGRMCTKKGLWLACESAGDSTGGRAHRPTAVLCFFIVDSLMSALFLSLSHHNGMKNDVTVWDPGLSDPDRCAHLPGLTAGETFDRPLTHEEIVRQNAAKSRSTPSCATGSSTRWTSGRQNSDGAYSGACARSSDFAPGCLTGSTTVLRTAGNGARHEQRRSAGRLCCHPQT